MNNLKTFEGFANESLPGITSETPVKDQIYKIYDADGKLEISAARFDGPDAKGNKFTILSRMKLTPHWIKPEDMDKYILVKGFWKEKKKK